MHRVRVFRGFENSPALLASSGNAGAQGCEVASALFRAEAAGDLLTQLRHSQITLGLIVREGSSQVGETPQASVLVCLETEGEVVPDAEFFWGWFRVSSGWPGFGPGAGRAVRAAYMRPQERRYSRRW